MVTIGWLGTAGCERLNALEEADTLFYEVLENISTYFDRFPNGLICTILVHKRRDKYWTRRKNSKILLDNFGFLSAISHIIELLAKFAIVLIHVMLRHFDFGLRNNSAYAPQT